MQNAFITFNFNVITDRDITPNKDKFENSRKNLNMLNAAF